MNINLPITNGLAISEPSGLGLWSTGVPYVVRMQDESLDGAALERFFEQDLGRFLNTSK